MGESLQFRRKGQKTRKFVPQKFVPAKMCTLKVYGDSYADFYFNMARLLSVICYSLLLYSFSFCRLFFLTGTLRTNVGLKRWFMSYLKISLSILINALN